MSLRPLFLSIFLLTLGLLKSFSAPIQLSASFPSDIEASKSVFNKCVEVLGLRVLATSGVSEAKTLHAANMLAEYLDNDEDGNVDQPEVLAALKGSSNAQIATMVLFASEQEQESKQSAFETFENSITRAQNLFAMEIFENGSNGSDRDATLEEVLHLVTDKGWDEAFPAIWGEKVGSGIALAMDKARGGHFETIPSSYPPSAWYSYYDDTADYGTQITEYVYWATTTYLGAQDWPGRVHDDYTGEWKPYTRTMLESTDPAVVALLTSTNYKFPISKLPDGNYSPSSTSSTSSDLAAYVLADATTDVSSGWKQSSWLGNFFDSGSNWIFHENLGWLYPVDSGLDATWLYHPNIKWMWTKKEFFPWLYLHNLQGWRYFSSSKGFYDHSKSKWTSFATLSGELSNTSESGSGSSTGSDSTASSFSIERVELSPGLISYFEANSSDSSGWTKVAEQSESSASGDLSFLQGDSSFERRARLIVVNYRSQVAGGGPVTLTIDGQNLSNSITIYKDSNNDQMVVTANGVPNYVPSVMGVDVSNGWNTAANGGFQSLKLSENNLGVSGGNNPNQVVAAEEIFRIPLNPVNNSTATDTSLGTVGVALNGIPVYNPFEDAQETAAYGRIFSGCCGHPQRNGVYHYHKYPTCLRLLKDDWKSEKDKCDEIDALLVSGGHSPLLGFAADGWPIYGPVGWRNDGNQTGLILKTSYTGTNDSAGNALFVEGSGHLDECNGLVSPTPDFPEGIYHYVMSIEADSDGTVLRYLNPHFGYDVRNTLNKHNLLPLSWSDDSAYLAALKSGFTVNGVSVAGTDSYSTFVKFIEGMQATLNANAMSAIASEFETMQIAYPYTIRKYRGTPSGSGVSGTGATTTNSEGESNTQGTGIVSISPSAGSVGSTVSVTITLDSNSPPPLPPANVAPSSVQIGGVALSGLVRSNTTTLTGSLAIPSSSVTGSQDVVVTFTTPRGNIQLNGIGFFSVE
ncbi:MAG: YHYH protein [Opitutae bacterium]|nr:YHYH protein [Opitutae bacterium]